MRAIKVNSIDDEYKYINTKHGQRDFDWFFVKQSLIEDKGKSFDEIFIKLSDGTRKSYLFDITSYRYQEEETSKRIIGILDKNKKEKR